MSLLLFGRKRSTPAESVSGLLSYWDPLNLATLFKEIAGTTPVSANGDTVGHMAGLVNAVASADDATRPTYAVAGINGRPSLNFASASSQRLTANAIATGALTGTDQPFSFVVVAQPALVTSVRYIVHSGNSGDANPIVGMRINAATLQQIRRATTVEGTKTATNGTLTAGVPVVLGGRFDGTSGDVWKDATQVAPMTDLDSSGMTLNRFTIGALGANVTTSFWDGPIGRLAIFNRLISTSEMMGVSRNFANAYGIGT